jgi:hypothetical protein
MFKPAYFFAFVHIGCPLALAYNGLKICAEMALKHNQIQLA